MSGIDSPAPSDKRTVTSVQRALHLLECFSHERPELTLAELARSSELNKTTTHRLLATLEAAGWVERTVDGAHRLTLRAFEVGSVATDSIDLRNEATPVLSELVAELGETAFLTVVEDDRAVCLERVESPQLVRILALDVGKSLPLTVGGGPVALLAFNQEELLPRVLEGDWAKYTDSSIGSRAALERHLAETVERGYALSREDVTHGICAIGAPVLDAEGRAVAALSVAGVSARFQPPREEEIAAAVVAACRRVSERVGHASGKEQPR